MKITLRVNKMMSFANNKDSNQRAQLLQEPSDLGLLCLYWTDDSDVSLYQDIWYLMGFKYLLAVIDIETKSAKWY